MAIDIVGNGNSNKLFKPRPIYTIGCNVPTHHISVNALSIIDNQPITWMKNNNWHPRVPVFCTEQVKTYAKKSNRDGDWMTVYEKRDRWNAGLHAAEYATRLTDTISLIGFDSLFSDDLTSQMDELVPRGKRPPLNQYWRPHWQTLFKNNPNTEYKIYIPQNNSIDFDFDNVLAVYLVE